MLTALKEKVFPLAIRRTLGDFQGRYNAKGEADRGVQIDSQTAEELAGSPYSREEQEQYRVDRNECPLYCSLE